MSVWDAALLGILQGLTEFFPVSSSGHLVLAQAALGVRVPGIQFEVIVHVGTLAAVLWAYRRRVAELIRGVWRRERASVSYALLLALASLPAALVGLLAADLLEGAFDRPLLAAGLLLVSGGLAWSLRRTVPHASAPLPDASRAFSVGVAQALAILPGLSRSGATVAVGAFLGVNAVRMAEFSFLLSVPAVAGAALLELGRGGEGAQALGVPVLVVGFLAALLSGILAIRIFVHMLRARTFHRFAYYCWAVGVGYLLLAAVVPGLRG